MSRTYKERKTTTTTITVESVCCDRCGGDGLCKNASAHAVHERGPWGFVRGLTQGTANPFEFDLCRQCTEELRTWIKG
jgi:hypothetical protein